MVAYSSAKLAAPPSTRWQEAACLVVMLLYGYMETQVLHVTSDPALLLLSGAVFALPFSRWNEADTSCR